MVRAATTESWKEVWIYGDVRIWGMGMVLGTHRLVVGGDDALDELDGDGCGHDD